MSCPTSAARALTCSRLRVSAPSPGSVGGGAATAVPVPASTTPTTSAPSSAVRPRRTRPPPAARVDAPGAPVDGRSLPSGRRPGG